MSEGKESQTRPADVLAEKYIRLRDFRAKVKAELDEKLALIDTEMEKIETEMMTFLNSTGQESSKTPAGTFFKKTSTSVKVADWDVIFPFIQEHELYQMLEHKVNKTAVEEYITVNNALPPGISITREVTIGVNRPKTR